MPPPWPRASTWMIRRRIHDSGAHELEGFSLGSYLILVDYTGRLFRDGKATISAELSGILNRLGCSAESWRARLEKLKGGRWSDSSPPAESACERSPHTWGYTTWQTSADAPRDNPDGRRVPFSSSTPLRASNQHSPSFTSPTIGAVPPPIFRSWRALFSRFCL